jgi:cytochrome c biogenesis protein CcdA/thiol-disulfide isomerase/thioredoxin
MILFLLAYLGGAFTIVSPCILPVLPFVFARSDQPFVKSGLPLLLGMAVTFAGVASLAAVGGGWVVQANGAGRIVAMVVLLFFGLLLLFPALADRATRPLVALGSRLTERASGSSAEGGKGSPFWTSLLLGVATGLLWAPCAGPILGLLLTGAALQGASVKTTLLLVAYAAGAATSLALALLVGGRVFAAMKRSLGAGEWIRRALGVAVIAGVVVVSLGLDTGFLTRLSTASTTGIEQALLDRFHMAKAPAQQTSDTGALPVEGQMPPLTGAVQWLNSPPLTAESLRGKVVLVDFWTYSCINCLRSLPYVEAWAQKYKDQGLVVIGVHTPEFAFERDVGNVTKAVRDLGVTYPVAIDNDHAIWRAFSNEYWPAHYFIDAQGRIRAHRFGEGDYAGSERIIQRLLAEAGDKAAPQDVVRVEDQGVGAAATAGPRSPETYVDYQQAKNFDNAGGFAPNQPKIYALPATPAVDHWGLVGAWTVRPEFAALNAAGGKIVYHFQGRDLHLVLGPSGSGKPVRFRVTLDGAAPGADHGVDVDAKGAGVVTGQRLYQLIRQQGGDRDRTFQIEFLDPGAQAYAFTFG